MGGRGASSGWSVDKRGDPKNPYGSQYHSVLTVGNIKFVSKNEGDDLKSIVYFDNENKRSKQIDVDHSHNGERPHTHHGYNHNENDSAKGAARLTPDEQAMVDKVVSIWENRKRGK